VEWRAFKAAFSRGPEPCPVLARKLARVSPGQLTRLARAEAADAAALPMADFGARSFGGIANPAVGDGTRILAMHLLGPPPPH
jgi:hypothetical protein